MDAAMPNDQIPPSASDHPLYRIVVVHLESVTNQLAELTVGMHGLRRSQEDTGQQVASIERTLVEHVAAEAAWQRRTDDSLDSVRGQLEEHGRKLAEHDPIVKDSRDAMFGGRLLAKAAGIFAAAVGVIWAAGHAVLSAINAIRHMGPPKP